MATKRLPMRKTRDALRLEASGLSRRQIAASLSIGRTAVRRYLDRARAVGLSWPLPTDLGDEALERPLFPPRIKVPYDQRAAPDWALLHLELRKPNVTLSLLWEAYRAIHPGAPGVNHDPRVIGAMAAHLVLPWIHRLFSNLKTWALGVYHGRRKKRLQSYLDAFTFSL